jgi:hypothetical protein
LQVLSVNPAVVVALPTETMQGAVSFALPLILMAVVTLESETTSQAGAFRFPLPLTLSA